MAKAAGISVTSVQRIWRAHGLSRILVLLSQKVAGRRSGEIDVGGFGRKEIRSSAEGAEMDLRANADSESRFAAYVEGLVQVIGHAVPTENSIREDN
jgi:hypothetical protein